MSKQPSIGEVSANSKLFLKFRRKAHLIAVFAALIGIDSQNANASNATAVPIPPLIKTLDQRSFNDCELIRAEPDAPLIQHSKGIARLSFSVLSTAP